MDRGSGEEKKRRKLGQKIYKERVRWFVKKLREKDVSF